jgi:Polysaccharide pyruvyl transferase
MYVLLHGARANAGDFLIKERAVALLSRYRPEQDLVELPRWEPVDAHLDVINRADAVILCGGPAFQRNLYPGIYPLTRDLDRIHPPIIPMALGWKHPRGRWADTWDYRFTPSSRPLLDRIAGSGFTGSCRDYHTLNALAHQAVTNLVMTGCAAWYDLDVLAKPPRADFAGEPVAKVAFSMGVRMYRDPTFRAGTLALLEALRERFGERLECVFHHPVQTHDNRQMLDFLRGRGIPHVEVSGSAKRMTDYYGGVDLHVGFRVHAHILMMSRNARSILIAEDGRGIALQTAMGGAVLDPFDERARAGLVRRLRRRPRMSDHAADDAALLVRHEEAGEFALARSGHAAIRAHLEVVGRFLRNLP